MKFEFSLDDPHFLPHCGAKLMFSLSDGENLTIVGENGVGKSTLAHAFWKANRTQVSLIEQRPLDIFYDRPLKKIKEILISSRRSELSEEFFSQLWERFGLAKKEERYHSALSGGEAQALKLCLGLAQNVQCFILDEPSQFLDSHMKDVLSHVLTSLLKEEKSILLIEHDTDWAKFSHRYMQIGVCDQVLKEVKSWST